MGGRLWEAIVKRFFKAFGKYCLFLLLNGLGGLLAATLVTVVLVDKLSWLVGRPETGTAYGSIVEVLSWGLWGLVGALVAIYGYSIIFKEFPPRWMGITSVSILLFGWILTTVFIVVGLSIGEEVELDQWKDFSHLTASIATFWYQFGLPPLARRVPDRL
jgi:hypothetical protein